MAVLGGDWLLRGWTDVSYAAVNWRTGAIRTLNPDAMYVLRACEGTVNFESAAFLPAHIALLDRFLDIGMAEACEGTRPAGEAMVSRQAYRRAPNPMLRRVHWAVTGRCNLACRHCFMQSPSGRYKEPSHREVLGLIDQFEEAGVPAVSLTGGEPFVRPDLLGLVEELTARKIGVLEIATNGLLLTDAVMDRIASTGQQPRFKISFDGCGTHDAMRGVAGLEPVVTDAIRRLVASRFEVVVATTVDTLNLEALERTYELMVELQVPVWLVGRTQSIGDCRSKARQVPTDLMADRCLRLAQRWHREGRRIGIQLERFFSGAPATAMGRCWGDQPAAPARFSEDEYECASCRGKPFLLPDGTLLPCAGFTDTPIASGMPNLFERSLSEAWTGSALRTFADMKKRSVINGNPECGTCAALERCGAGCRAYALTEAGDLMARDPWACELWTHDYRQRFRDAVAGNNSEWHP